MKLYVKEIENNIVHIYQLYTSAISRFHVAHASIYVIYLDI